jgi:hypothetical protein
MQMKDRHTDMKKLIFAFRNIENASNIISVPLLPVLFFNRLYTDADSYLVSCKPQTNPNTG